MLFRYLDAVAPIFGEDFLKTFTTTENAKYLRFAGIGDENVTKDVLKFFAENKTAINMV